MKPQFEKDSGGAVIPCCTKPGQCGRMGSSGGGGGGAGIITFCLFYGFSASVV